MWRVTLVALGSCKKPLKWLITLYLIFLALSPTAISFLEDVELEKLCELPIVPNLFSNCTPKERFNPDFRKLVTLQSHLQGAMEKSTSTLAVAIDLKHSEIAVRDLTTLVKVSSLVSKDGLSSRLEKFVENARTTGRSLQRFGGHVGRAVDETIAMNEYTIEVLESMAKDEEVSTLKKLSSPRIPAFRNGDIKATWFEATEQLKLTVHQLIDEALDNTRALDKLDEELVVINQMVAREDNKIVKDKAETLDSLWTRLGGNKGKQFESGTFGPLSNDYRKNAAAHVNGALSQLQRIELDLNALNEQVTGPLLANARDDPLEVHIGVMQRGTARLLEGRTREPFALFFAYGFEIFYLPNNLGFGTPAPIASLSNTWTRDTIYYVDATNSSVSRVPDFISTLVTSSKLSQSQQSRLKPLASRDAVQQACPSSFRLVSKCFAVLIFDYIPSGLEDPRPMSYVMRFDVGRRIVNVGKHTSDSERVALPLQWAVEKAGMEMLGVKGVAIPQEWPYTIQTNKESLTQRRIAYLSTIESLMVIVLFVAFIGVAYRISGAFVDECATGLASLMHVMGCSYVARITSWYLSISLFYVPAWVSTAIIWHYRIFTKTNVGILILIHIITGYYPLPSLGLRVLTSEYTYRFSLTSFSLLACMPFRKSPQLAAIGTTFLALLCSIVALLAPMTSVIAALSTLVFPPGFFVFAIRAVSRFEMNQQRAHATFKHGESDARILAYVMLVGSVNIFLWLLVAAIVEQWMLDPNAGSGSPLRRLHRLGRPTNTSQPEFKDLAMDESHIPIITSKSHSVSPAITLDRLTKTFPSAKWNAPDFTAVKDLSMTIPSHGIFVLLGANGSGKSTTLKMIAGLERQTSGLIRFGNESYGTTERQHTQARTGRRTLGLVPQKDILFPELTCYQTLELWRDIKLPYASPDSPEPLEIATKSVEQLLNDCGLESKMHSLAATLSGGQKRRLQLATGLVGDSRIVLVDEATSGVDPLSRRAIWRALTKAREGRCIVFTTHKLDYRAHIWAWFLDEADLLADEIAILAAPGKLLAQGSPVSLKSQLGDGYTVHVTRTDSAPLSLHHPVLSTIQAHAPLAAPDDEPNAYILHSKDAQVVGEVLDTLEERKEELGIASYDVKGTTLETVFLKLLGTEDSAGSIPLDSRRVESAKFLDSDPFASEETLVGGHSHSEVDREPEPLALSDGHKTSPFRQALTGFHKRALILRRSWISYALMVAVGIAGACVPLVFIKGRTSTCSIGRDTQTTYPLYLPAARFLPASIMGETVPTNYWPVISPPNLLKVLHASNMPQRKVADANAFSQTIKGLYRNLSLGGLEIHHGEATIAWEASPGSVSGLALLNLASNVLLNGALGRNGTGPLMAWFQPLPGARPEGMGAAAKWEGFFGAFMGLWPAFFVLYVSNERRSLVQAMQLSNGMTPAGLWLGHLLFDLPWIVFIASVMVTIFGTVTSQFYGLGALWAVLVLYGIAGALFAYIVSTFAKSPLIGFAVTGSYNALVSLLYGSAYILTLAYTRPSELEGTLQIVHYTLSLMSPIVSVVRAAIVSINLFSVLCDGLGNYSSSSPMAMNKFGGPIVYLIGWIAFLFSLLMWTEYGKPIPKWLRPKDNTETTEVDLEKLMAHNGVFSAEVKAEAERVHSSQDALRVLDITKRFPGRFTAVDDVSFGVDNETLALLGPNGAGKTTTFNIIRGNIRPTEGDVRVNGKSIVHNLADARLSLGVTPQFSAADSQLTVNEHLMIYGSLKGLHGKELKRNVELLMEATALKRYESRLATKLSGGNGRKLSLALALIGNPRVLLIDEYSTGVDAATKRAMWKTLRRVSSGKAVVITTHSMEEASALASRVGILAKRMLAIGTPDSLASRFSTYEIHFAARTPLEVSRARMVMSQLPGSRESEDVATRFEVPIGDTSLAGLFRALGSQKDEEDGAKMEYTVERLGLESVFLKVIKEQGMSVKAEPKAKRWWGLW
ncbi:hypothetical protein FRC07_008009 [Ceratobasidium sp. 392]|nr:hypothetical protein FRC07_008009 [Ceratobasidium sp. 392]